jgi:hypothetical protein
MDAPDEGKDVTLSTQTLVITAYEEAAINRTV